MKYRFVRYRFVRYRFRFLSRPWINTDILVNILFISKTSSRRLQDMSWRRLQEVFNVTIFRLPRRLQDVLLIRLEDISQDVLKTSWRRFRDLFARCFQDIIKTSWRRLGRREIVALKTCWRRLEDISGRRLEDQQMFAGPTYVVSVWSIFHFDLYFNYD